MAENVLESRWISYSRLFDPVMDLRLLCYLLRYAAALFDSSLSLFDLFSSLIVCFIIKHMWRMFVLHCVSCVNM